MFSFLTGAVEWSMVASAMMNNAYYNPRTNRISAFYPEFVFWLQKKNEYSILFVDPKGTKKMTHHM